MAANELTTIESILDQDDIKIVPLVVPEWGGGTVYIKTMTGTERDAFEILASKALEEEKPDTNIRAELAVRVLCKADGTRVFAQPFVKKLGRKNAKALDRVYDVARELNGMDDDAIERAEENSEPGQSEDSGSSLLPSGTAQ